MPWRLSRRAGRRHAAREARRASGGERADVLRRAMAGALMLAVVACGVVAFKVVPELDMRTLRESLDGLSPTIIALERWPTYRASAMPFGVGLLIGWCTALWWAHGRWSWRSVLLVDNRQPDMSLPALLLHLQRHASETAPEALRRIAGAARAGRLSIWSSSASGTLRRLPQRLVKPALARQLQGDSDESRGRMQGHELFFVHTEVRRLWPLAPPIAVSTPTALQQKDDSVALQ